MRAVIAIAVLLAAAMCFCSGSSASAAEASKVCEKEMMAAAERYDVPVGVLYAVGLTETGNKRIAAALRDEHRGPGRLHRQRRPTRSRASARPRAGGVKLIDLGCMQINHHYHREKFSSLQAMLDPHRNVEYAARLPEAVERARGQLDDGGGPLSCRARTTIRRRSAMSAAVISNMVARVSAPGRRTRGSSAGDLGSTIRPIMVNSRLSRRPGIAQYLHVFDRQRQLR